MTSPSDRGRGVQPSAAVLFDRRPPPAVPGRATDRPDGAGRPRLRERESVFGELVATFRGLSRPGPIVIEGGPGLGKTALVNAACHLAREEGLAVLSARGSQLEAAYPFSVVRQLFEHLLALLEPDRRRECLETLGSGVLAGTAPAGDADLPHVFDEFSRAVAFLAEHQPLVIAIDDLQWCDPASAQWFEYLSRRLAHRRVWLIGSTLGRSGTEATVAVDRVVADPATRTFVLEPLSAGAVGELVAEQFAEPGVAELAAACYRATVGNPFLLFALLSWLRASGPADAARAASVVDQAVPPQVVRALLHRTYGLPEGAYRLAQAAAVLEGRAGIREAAELAGMDLEVARAAADALAEAGIVTRDGTLGFVYPLERAAAYGDLGPASRAALHAEAARLLDDHGAPAAVVAEHLTRCEPLGEAWRAERLVQGAELAAAAGNPERAAALLERALAEPPSADQRGSILVALARHQAAAGSTEALGRLRDAAEAAVEPAHYAQAALDVVHQLAGAAPEGALAVLRSAAAGLGQGDDPALRLRLGARLAQLDPTVRGVLEVAPALEQVLGGRLAGRSPEERTALAVLCSCWELVPDRMAAAQLAAIALGAVRVEELEGADDAAVDAAVRALEAAARAGAWAQAEPLARSAQEVARRLGRTGAEAAFGTVVARCQLAAGQLREAEATLGPVLAAPPHDGRAEVVAARVALELGQPAEAAELLDRASRSARHAGSLAELWALELRGEVHAVVGEGEAALGDFRLAGQLAEEWGVRNPAVTGWRAGAARASAALGSARDAHELASENLSLARAFGAPAVVGAALAVMAEVVEPVERLALLDEAVTVLQPAGPSLELARTTLELGRTLRVADRPVAARTALRQAADLAVRCGSPWLIEQSLRELRASGARPRRLAFSGADSLTPSERRVADLAAAGMTNARIAELLFVTTKTVEGHLSRVYQKLGVQSRDELRRLTSPAGRPGADPTRLVTGRSA